MPQRDVFDGDALEWLRARAPLTRASLVTSLPDLSESGMSHVRWLGWFVHAAELSAASVDGLAIFVQTDIRREGLWIDKSALVAEGAARAGMRLLSRKVVCSRRPGSLSSSRAGFSHLLLFGREPLDRARPEVVPDVLLDGGEVTWKGGLGHRTAQACIALVSRYSPLSQTIVDPFCGEGMVLAAANDAGLSAVGVDWNRKRAAKARLLQLPRVGEG